MNHLKNIERTEDIARAFFGFVGQPDLNPSKEYLFATQKSAPNSKTFPVWIGGRLMRVYSGKTTDREFFTSSIDIRAGTMVLNGEIEFDKTDPIVKSEPQ